MAVEYWRWPEEEGVSTGADCKGAAVVTAGVDIGALSTKAAIMCDGELAAYSVIRTDADSKGSAQNALDKVVKAAGLEMGDIQWASGEIRKAK